MARYRVRALQLLCVKSGVFFFFLFFFKRKLSVFEHLIKAEYSHLKKLNSAVRYTKKVHHAILDYRKLILSASNEHVTIFFPLARASQNVHLRKL